MEQKKERGLSKTLDEIFRNDMGNGEMADQAIRELSALGQEWGKTRAFLRRTPETEGGFTPRPF